MTARKKFDRKPGDGPVNRIEINSVQEKDCVLWEAKITVFTSFDEFREGVVTAYSQTMLKEGIRVMLQFLEGGRRHD